jgi:hypothetical protein
MVSWSFRIGQLEVVPEDSHCGFAFWNGMGRPTQESILNVVARCTTMDRLAVFRDASNWTGYTEGSLLLSEFGSVPPSRFFIDG